MNYDQCEPGFSFLELARLYNMGGGGGGGEQVFGSSDFTEKNFRISDLANILLPWIR